MNKARLENWSVSVHGGLQGDVHGHPNPKLIDGQNVHTSEIVSCTEDGEVITNNTIYTLGEIDPAYEKLYPGARERLLSSLVKRLEEELNGHNR